MFYFILLLFFIIAILMAFWSLKKQKMGKEIEFVNKELKKKRVIYDYSSSSSEESSPR
ncbi:MAG TPA: hypothetical protein VNW29_01425 [Candidatus Sulfotelmatobacter sp.]|jgi:hypothetical protein|nr:hypothetical protein [Candidatus Sulfotelmatobacter sp.]